jgi:hypothetical protein
MGATTFSFIYAIIFICGRYNTRDTRMRRMHEVSKDWPFQLGVIALGALSAGMAIWLILSF